LRYGIISDIHGNLEALSAVLDEIQNREIDQLICLGDIVGYGANPNECIELVRQNCQIILAGNHDYAALKKVDTSNFNNYAQDAIGWTIGNLNPESTAFLDTLKVFHKVDQIYFVHSTPLDPTEWNYILSTYDAYESFQEFQEQICFIGHSHVPIIFLNRQRHRYDVIEKKELLIDQKNRYIINVGSVGQPRDLDSRAAYGIFDDELRSFTLYRVEYDIEKTQAKMRAAGLPEFLIIRLQIGK
jgi:predicted phosphodiesterase